MIAQQESWTAAVVTWVAVGLMLAGSGWLIVVMARRTADGRLGPNAWAGMRTKATRSSDEAWLAAHQASLGTTVASGWIFIGASILSPLLAWLLGDSPDQAMGWWGGALTAGTILAVGVLLLGARKAQNAAIRVRDGLP